MIFEIRITVSFVASFVEYFLNVVIDIRGNDR